MVIEQHTDARLRWAIQMANVNSLKYRGNDKLADMLGKQGIEHSFTQYCKIWCDHNDQPLCDPVTGSFYQPEEIRGWINPGAINPRNGEWTAMRIDPESLKSILSIVPPRYVDVFNQYVFDAEELAAERHRLGVFAFYGDFLNTFDPDVLMKDPITLFVGDEIDAERKWNECLQRANKLNHADLDYDLRLQNCHTATCYINGEREGLAQEFTRRRFFRWGANPGIIDPPEIGSVAHLSLQELRQCNLDLSIAVHLHHERKAIKSPQSLDVGREVPWTFEAD